MRYYSAQDFPGGSVVKNCLLLQETWDGGLISELGRSPGVGNGSILAEEIPWTEESGSYSPWGCRVGHN